MYVVRWKRTALDSLANLWLEAGDRASVNNAVAEIDRTLARDPNLAGESRSENIRVLFSPPLGVFFEVNELHQAVFVLQVWIF
jgi:hypothetical protein